MTEPIIPAPQPTGAQPTGAQPTGAPTPIDPLDPRLRPMNVPEKYASEPWAREVKDVEDLWSKMAGAQKLLGKDKIVVPGQNATPEEIAEFHVKLGRPENPEGYEFKSLEDLKDIERNVTLDHGMKKIFFEEGIPKEVGERIVSKYEGLVYEMHKPMIEESAKRETEFQQLATQVLGEDRSSAIDAFKAVMKESLGDKAHLASKIETMSNEELLPLMVLSKNIHDKYVGENRIPTSHGTPGSLTGDLKTDYQHLSQEKIRIKTDQNMPEHIKKMKLANLNLKMMAIGEKAGSSNIDLFT